MEYICESSENEMIALFCRPKYGRTGIEMKY